MKLEIDDKELKHGLLGLVLAIVEVVRDTLKIESVKRMEGGNLTEEQIERLGNALIELDHAIDKIKEEQGVSEAVKSVRDGLDDLVARMVHSVADPAGVCGEGPKVKEERKISAGGNTVSDALFR